MVLFDIVILQNYRHTFFIKKRCYYFPLKNINNYYVWFLLFIQYSLHYCNVMCVSMGMCNVHVVNMNVFFTLYISSHKGLRATTGLFVSVHIHHLIYLSAIVYL